MKRRTVITVSIVVSLFPISALPASASTSTVNSISDAQEPALLQQILNTLPEGYHDASEGLHNQFSCLAEGWATDPDDRSIDLNVRILSDGIEVAQTVAGVFRQDLDDAGACPDGTCGFEVDLWGLISPDTDHSITAQALDAQTGEWVNLNDTPKTNIYNLKEDKQCFKVFSVMPLKLTLKIYGSFYLLVFLYVSRIK